MHVCCLAKACRFTVAWQSLHVCCLAKACRFTVAWQFLHVCCLGNACRFTAAWQFLHVCCLANACRSTVAQHFLQVCCLATLPDLLFWCLVCCFVMFFADLLDAVVCNDWLCLYVMTTLVWPFGCSCTQWLILSVRYDDSCLTFWMLLYTMTDFVCTLWRLLFDLLDAPVHNDWLCLYVTLQTPFARFCVCLCRSVGCSRCRWQPARAT